MQNIRQLKRGVMMTTIKTTCKQCGDVELPPDDVFLTLDVSGKVMVYLFQCPYCTQDQERTANPWVIGALLGAGVRYRVREPAITEDDIGNFAQASKDGRLDDELKKFLVEERP